MNKTYWIIASVLILGIISCSCDHDKERRKIKLSDQSISQNQNQQFTSTIRLEPKDRRTIAVMFFQNLTGDDKLQWLQKGLTEMLIRALSQSSSLSILSTDRLLEILERVGATRTPQDIDLDLAAIVGKEANVEAVLVGQIRKKGGVLTIHVKLQEPSQGMILKEESVEGKGLDAIFTMVDELTQKVKDDLQLTFEKSEAIRGISDITTNNLEAWREFTTGNDFVDKYLNPEAIPHFENAVRLDSNFTAALLDLSTLYFAAGKNNEAFQLFQKLKKLRSISTPKEQYQIDLLQAQINNDAMEYLRTLDYWIKKYPDDIEAYLTAATIAKNWRNEEKEIEYYQRALAIDPKDKVTYNRLGYAYANLGYFDQAIATIDRYKELAPDEANPYDSAGEIYLLYGENDKAERNFKKALAANRNFLHSILFLGHVYMSSGKYEKALVQFQQYLKQATTPNEKSNANFMIGSVYMILGQFTQAQQYYEQAMEQNTMFVSLDMLHDIYAQQNKPAQFDTLLQTAYRRVKEQLNSDTRRIQALFALSWLSIRWKVNNAETIEILNQVITGLEDSANPSIKLYATNVKFMLTLLYGVVGQPDRIEPLWQGQVVFPAEIWHILSDVRDNSFSDDWVPFGLLNKLFYQYPEEGVAFYQPLIEYAKENQAQSFEMMFRLFLADLYSCVNDTIKAEEQRKIVGVPNEKTWLVIGPFEYKDGFRKKYPPEKKIQLNKSYPEKSWQVKWQPADDVMEDGFINFRELFQKDNWKVAYGLIYLESPNEQEVQFRFGSDDGSKVWLNDQEIWRLNRNGDAVFDDNNRTVKLHKGRNKVLIKVNNTVGDWGFFFRVTDEKGIGVPDIRFVAAE